MTGSVRSLSVILLAHGLLGAACSEPAPDTADPAHSPAPPSAPPPTATAPETTASPPPTGVETTSSPAPVPTLPSPRRATLVASGSAFGDPWAIYAYRRPTFLCLELVVPENLLGGRDSICSGGFDDRPLVIRPPYFVVEDEFVFGTVTPRADSVSVNLMGARSQQAEIHEPPGQLNVGFNLFVAPVEDIDAGVVVAFGPDGEVLASDDFVPPPT